VTLDTDHPAMRRGLDRLFRITQRQAAAKARGGVIGKLQRAGLGVAAAATFARLYLLPGKHAALPAQIRMAPAW